MNFTRSLFLVSTFAAVFSTVGCGKSAVEEYCEAKCACELCSDPALDACVIETERLRNTAETNGCAEAVDAALSCLHTTAECRSEEYGGGQFETDGCVAEQEAMQQCVSS
ncbi:hypothetical protein [Chondromyces crocatus]|nr:hypothetical protein [Chondromyces crocatus]